MRAFIFSAITLLLSVLVSGQNPPPVCGPNDTYLPHPDCTKYYICDNTVPVEKDCPEGLYYNVEFETCDFPINVPECEGGTRPPGVTEIPPTTAQPPTTTAAVTTQPPTTTRDTPATEPTASTTATPETPATEATESPATEPTAGPTTTATPPTSDKTTEETPATEATLPTSTVPPLPGQCPAEGIHKIPHEALCDRYYLCVDGQKIEQSCAAGLYFDPQLGDCNYADQVDCTPVTTTLPPTTTRPPIPECPDSGTFQLPYPGNCTLYILCFDGIPILSRCPEGLLFDIVDLQCKPENIALCADSVYRDDQDKVKDVKEAVKKESESQEFHYYQRFMDTLNRKLHFFKY